MTRILFSESRMTRITRMNADKIPASTPFDTDKHVLSNTLSARGIIRVHLRHLRHLRFRTQRKYEIPKLTFIVTKLYTPVLRHFIDNYMLNVLK